MLIPILFFLGTTFIIGMYASGLIEGKVRNFFVAGNVIPFWVLSFSQVGQAIELGGTLDNANFSLSHGLMAGVLLPAGIGLSLIFIGLFFAEPLNKMKLLTLPDFYQRRFGKKVELMVSLITVFSFIVLLAGNLAGAGILLNFIFPDYSVVFFIAMTGLIVMSYTMMGGLFAVTWNDVLHVGVGLLGFLAALIWVLSQQGVSSSVNLIFENINISLITNFKEGGALGSWAGFLALALGDIVALDFMERVFAAKNPRSAKMSCLIAGIVTIFVGIVMSVLGVFTLFYIHTDHSSKPFLDFITHVLPPGISMMVFIGLIGACISTADGAIMSMTTVLSRNVFSVQFPKIFSPVKLLFWARFFTVPITVSAVAFAIFDPHPGDLLILAFDVVFAGCLIPLCFGVYTKRGGENTAFAAILFPSVLRLSFQMPALNNLIPDYLTGIQTLLPPLLSLLIYITGIMVQEKGKRKQFPA